MNTSPAPVVGILDRLSIGVSRTSIRHYAAPRQFKKKKYHLTGFKVGHGERIFVYNHIENGMIVYSHDPELKRDDNRILDQIPFTVKKQKPALLRRDYWRPLCMIQFDAGRAVVGRNVFQKLREFRALHELHWGWQAKELRNMAKHERGAAIHNQKPNAVADIAAVLGGVGRGNLMWTAEEPVGKKIEEEMVEESAVVQAVRKVEEEDVDAQKPTLVEAEAAAPSTPADAPEVTLTASPAAPTPSEQTAVSTAPKVEKEKAKAPKPAPGPKRLLPATIYWSNDVDLDWARKWSKNVVHEVGLPEGVEVWNWQTKLLRQELTDNFAAKVPVDDSEEAAAKPETKTEQKKTWLDSLVGSVRWSRKEEARA